MRKRKPLLTLLSAPLLSLPLLVAPAAAAEPHAPPTPAPHNSSTRQLDDVIPAPVETHPSGARDFWLSPFSVIRTEPGSGASAQVGEYLANLLRPATGYPLPVRATERSALPGISLRIGENLPRIGEQGYRLNINPGGIVIKANTGDGLFNGVQTLRQLLPAEIEANSPRWRIWTVPSGRILDYPRFSYRGAMLDLARHFHTVDEIKTYLDEIAQYKINHLHLHLTDDQGWRIEIDSWPKLAPVGGGEGTGVDGVGGGYLTKAEYAEVIDYASSRHITIVPEIDMPGHVRAAMSTYAELNCDGTAPPPRTDIKVGYSSLCIDKEITYEFVEDVIREVAAMTPGPYIHIGGDEAHATTEDDYQKFMSKVLPMVAEYGKRAIGWHQVAATEPPESTIPQYWGTDKSAPTVAEAAARGNKTLMSPATHAYIDQKYNEDTELGLEWAGYTSVHDAYNWDPASTVNGVGENAIFGVEAPLWSETLRELDDIEFMAFPRLPAIAEIGWSPRSRHDWQSFSTRLAEQDPRWKFQGIDFYRSPQIDWK